MKLVAGESSDENVCYVWLIQDEEVLRVMARTEAGPEQCIISIYSDGEMISIANSYNFKIRGLTPEK